MRPDPLFQLDSDPNRPFRVLMVKLSSLGDVIHTLPVLQDLRQYRSDIVIDWVVEDAFADLVAQADGVRKVIRCELRRWVRSPFSSKTKKDWKAFVANLRSERYDAVFDLQGLSKSAMIAAMAKMTIPGQRIAMANRTEGSSYEVLTRLAADVAIRLEPHVHAVTRGRLLCAKSQNYPVPEKLNYGLSAWTQSSGSTDEVVLVTASSRDKKNWPLAQWVALVQKLSEQGLTSVLVHGTDAEQARCQRIIDQSGPQARTVLAPRMTLDALAVRMSRSSGVIGLDTGLSHLAVALDLPHVQLYNFDTAWRTGPLPAAHQVSVVGKPHPTLDQVWDAWCSVRSAAV